jgi:hypothetical protein
MSTDQAPNKPRRPIRRFDVFAEYNRIKNEEDGMPADQARGRAIWVAKVVAGRRGMPASPKPATAHGKAGHERHQEPEKEEKYLSVGGEVQTDRTFEHEIVERMGRDFYDAVFSPAIEAAYREGKQYAEIRDSIRSGWK